MLTAAGAGRQPGLVGLVRRTLLRECRVRRGDGLLLAVSGGPDSMALLGAMSELGPALGLRIFACGVDHGLRAESSTELDLAQKWADAHGVSFARREVNLASGSNLQARARDARYAALMECLGEHQLDYIVTAHHQDDRAETVLLRILRGAGPAGLQVLPPRTGNRLRPLIRATKAQVLAYLERRQITFALDPSNDDRRFLRVRVRHELLPLLRDLSPGIVEHLNNLADELAEEPLPEVLDERGDVVLLNRSQRAQLRQALALRQVRSQIWLAHGRAITIEPETNQPRLSRTGHLTGEQEQNSSSRATKSSKSH